LCGFAIAVAVLILWGLPEPLLSFSDTWQLIINTDTTIIPFLIGFVLQNTQNRESETLHLRLGAIVLELMVSNSKPLMPNLRVRMGPKANQSV
jgi:low affinity Fe/Cu permease